MLQCSTVCCSVLQCVAVCCSECSASRLRMLIGVSQIESMCSLQRSLQTGGSCSKELGQREETETNDWPSEQYAQPLLESMIYVARRQHIVAPARSTI